MKNAVRILCKRILGLLTMVVLVISGVLLFEDGGVVEVMRADALSGVRLPVIMYHSVLRDPQRAGEYVVSPALLEKDLQYLKKNGYTTVLPEELVSYINGEAELPENPVMVTFDDGYYNNLVYVLPILKRLEMKAVVSVVGAYTQRAEELMDQNPAYAYLNWEDIKALEASGYIDIASHTYNLHANGNGREGVKRKSWETKEAHAAILTKDVDAFRTAMREHCGMAVTTFTYPFGHWDQESEAVLRAQGFTVTLTCRERINYIERNNPASLFHLGRYNRPSGISTEKFMEKALGG